MAPPDPACLPRFTEAPRPRRSPRRKDGVQCQAGKQAQDGLELAVYFCLSFSIHLGKCVWGAGWGGGRGGGRANQNSEPLRVPASVSQLTADKGDLNILSLPHPRQTLAGMAAGPQCHPSGMDESREVACVCSAPLSIGSTVQTSPLRESDRPLPSVFPPAYLFHPTLQAGSLFCPFHR